MAITKTIIISNALALLGHKPIITLDNGDDLTIAAEQAFDMLLPSVLSSCNWRFAITVAQLSQLPGIPPIQTNWTAIYGLPSGYLQNIRIYPQNYNYEIYNGNQIFCNWNGAFFMEYAFLVPVNELPPYFVNYFVFEIAAYLALSNAQKPDFYNVLEQKRIMMQAMASGTDAKNRPNFSQIIFPVLQNRYIGGWIGNTNG